MTEVFAATLDAVPTLAARSVRSWLDMDVNHAEVHVATQVPTATGYFVDLELRFGPFPEPQRVVWVEAKHGTDLGYRQLERYQEEVADRYGRRGHVVLIAPEQSMPENRPADVRAITWQSVADEVRGLRREEVDPVSRWLLEQFNRYLKEEGLAQQEPLDAGLVFSLTARIAAERTVTRVSELADAYLASGWGDRTDDRKRRLYGVPFWAKYGSAPRGEKTAPAWNDAWFEFGFRPDLREDGTGGFVFVAGASWVAAQAKRINGAEYAGWRARVRTKGFEHIMDEYWRLWRYLNPDQLLAETTVEDQARTLGRWALKSFRELAKASPTSQG